ncbi:MAG TPA: hypothetical protein PK459_06845 [Anaerolineaceae bacterium]|jgi:Na+-transporting methylmalonyl-CoA/oxaloacetate decarboxylase gamma subunit|nr:hypothetical protein [Anaerolineaceae bacterium]HNZ14469.1 hypothetical protein [Anaerolineaceae bacterium]HOH91975.1 hypothetical protein [Anaerolineaceae bacterium]HPX66165.1 hypothetical protein [Anaerolineaceae bacterium]HQC64799.1 hypothetical protein [Anaerolineaceae bacterium]
MLEDNVQIIITIAGVIFLLGIVCLVISIIILARQAMNRNIRTIAESTAKLAQKGLTDGVSGLVGNASMLLSSLNDLTQSNTGIGIFFVFLSLVLLAVAYFLLKPILFVAP